MYRNREIVVITKVGLRLGGLYGYPKNTSSFLYHCLIKSGHFPAKYLKSMLAITVTRKKANAVIEERETLVWSTM